MDILITNGYITLILISNGYTYNIMYITLILISNGYTYKW